MSSAPDSKTHSLLKKAVSFASGDGATAVVNVAVFTMLLRYMSPADFGYLSIGQAISMWVQPVLYMGANMVAVRMIAAEPQHTSAIARRMFGVRLAATAVVSACTVAVALHSSDRSLTLVLLAYAFLFFFYPVQPDFLAIGLHRARVYRIGRWIGSACFLVLIAILTRIYIRAWMVPVAYAAGMLLSAGYGFMALRPALRSHQENVSIGVPTLFRGAIVVVAAQFVQMGTAALDVILLKWFKVPIALIGDYSAICRLVSMGCLPFVALIYSLAPLYVEALAGGAMDKIKEIEWRFRMLLIGAGTAGAVGIITIGPRVLQLVSGRAMPTAHQLAPICALICFAVAVQNSYTAILVYGGATHLYLATYASGFLATLVVGIALIPRFSTMGAAYAELAGYTAFLVAGYFFHGRYVRQHYRAMQLRTELTDQAAAISS